MRPRLVPEKDMSNYRRVVVVLWILSAAACSSSPSQPSATSNPLGAPVPSGPSDKTLFRNVDQPVTLAVQNVPSGATGATTYAFEVATDSAFATKVQTKDNVAE